MKQYSTTYVSEVYLVYYQFFVHNIVIRKDNR